MAARSEEMTQPGKPPSESRPSEITEILPQEDDVKFDFEEDLLQPEQIEFNKFGSKMQHPASSTSNTSPSNCADPNLAHSSSLMNEGTVDQTPSKQLAGSKNHTGHSAPATNHQVVCRHWIRGMCWKGDACEFSHQYDANKMPLCRAFLKNGHCIDHERGTCLFSHEEEGNVPICIHYYLGYCRAGPNCRKKHQRLPPNELPKLVPDWYLHIILENARNLIPEVCDPATEKILEEVERDCRGLTMMKNKLKPKHHHSDAMKQSRGHLGEQTRDVRQKRRHRSDLHHEDLRMTSDNIARAESMEPAIPPQTPDHPCRAVIIKSSNLLNLRRSSQVGIWATSKHNTTLLEQAFLSCAHVILLFSANESGGFQGFGRMVSLPSPNLYPDFWGSHSTKLGYNFRVQWLKQCNVAFEKLGKLINPLNDNQPIRKSRDCQEIPYDLAMIICNIMSQEPDDNLATVLGNQSDSLKLPAHSPSVEVIYGRHPDHRHKNERAFSAVLDSFPPSTTPIHHNSHFMPPSMTREGAPMMHHGRYSMPSTRMHPYPPIRSLQPFPQGPYPAFQPIRRSYQSSSRSNYKHAYNLR